MIGSSWLALAASGLSKVSGSSLETRHHQKSESNTNNDGPTNSSREQRIVKAVTAVMDSIAVE